MAGGTFNKLAGKTRPGTYINFESTKSDVFGISERGIVVLPLINHCYGPEKEFITLTNSVPDEYYAKLGFSVYDDNEQMFLIKEAFKNASKVIVYITKVGEKAVASAGGVVATAKYGGSRGNDLKYSIMANPLGGFDINIYMAESVVELYENILTVDELLSSEYIDFISSGDLTPVSGINLSNGTDIETSNIDMSRFLDEIESVKFNTLALPIDDDTLKEACKSKIKYLREDVGKGVNACIPNYKADYEGIINVTGEVVVDEKELTSKDVVAWVSGVSANASNTKSNTYVRYEGATKILNAKTHDDAVKAIKNGELFFSYSEENDIIIEYDINSLISFTTKKDKSYSKNRTIRVFDTFAESIKINFPPNMFDNSPTGWDIMEGIGKVILRQFYEAGAIKNVDYDNDFLVDRQTSSGDEVYFNIGLEPVDSAEKLFFTIRTR